MSSRSSQVIPQVATYFGAERPLPIIVAAFRPAEATEAFTRSATGLSVRSGWQDAAFQKHVSRSWLRKIKTFGYTNVRLELDGRAADFSIDELLA